MLRSFFKKSTRSSREVFESLPPLKENWSYNLDINNMVVGFRSDDKIVQAYLKNTYHQFFTSKKAEYIFHCYPYQGKFLGEQKEEDGSYKYSWAEFMGTYFYYRQHKIKNHIDVILPDQPLNWEVENFFKMFLSSRSINHNMLLLHVSAVITPHKQAILFIGESGAGKSTIAQLSGWEIIHDDNIMLSYLGKHQFNLSTIPLKRDYIKKVFEGEIKAAYRIIQSNKNHIVKINKREQMLHLLFSLWGYNDFKNELSENYNNDIVNYCAKVLPMLDIQKLYFKKSSDFVTLL